MASIEELLLAQAAQDNADAELAGNITGALGALTGGALAADAGGIEVWTEPSERSCKTKYLNEKALYDALTPEVQATRSTSY